MSIEPIYDFPPPRRIITPELQDLLAEEGSPIIGSDETAIGTGAIIATGLSRSGKTTAVWGLVDWVVAHTSRPVVLANYPQKVIEEGLPDHWKGRIHAMNPSKMHEVKPDFNAVWVIDDAAASMAARRHASKGSVQWSQLAGVFSHIGGGQTIIYTTQSLAGLDKTVFRFTELCLLVRYMNESGLKNERDEWSEEIEYAQHLLRRAHAGIPDSRRLRSFYITVSNGRHRVVPYAKPRWLFEGLSPKQRDMMSRPFRYMEPVEILALIDPNAVPKKRGRPPKKTEDDEA